MEEISSKLENMDLKDGVNDVIRKIYTHGYEVILVYIYYSGSDVDTLDYIKSFQELLDRFKIGSQVVIHNDVRFENPGINNCYHTNTESKHWADICLSEEPFLGVLIKERPRMSPMELLKLVRDVNEYSDDFIQVKEIL